MKLESGKKYRTETGEVWDVDYAGCVNASGHNARGYVRIFSLAGVCYAFPSSNLVAEWLPCGVADV